MSSSEDDPNEHFQAWLHQARDRRVARSRGLEFSSRVERYEDSTPSPLSSWGESDTQLPTSPGDTSSTSSSDDSSMSANTSTSPCPSPRARALIYSSRTTDTYKDKDLGIGTTESNIYPLRSRKNIITHRKNVLRCLKMVKTTHLLPKSTFRSSTFLTSKYKVSKFVRPYHGGCVNAVGWNREGTLLASSGDDLRVHVNKTDDLFRPTVRPEMSHDRTTLVNFETGHTSNVFQCKFSKTASNQIITAARDGRVFLHDYEYRKSACLLNRTDECWSGSIHRLAMIDHDSVVYAQAEACKILKIDTRTKLADFICTNPKAVCSTEPRFKPISMYALDRNPLQPNLLAFGGCGSANAAIIDLRMVRVTNTSFGPLITNLRNFKPKDTQPMATPYDFTLTPSVTDLKFSKTGDHLLVSNSPGKIYLYDTNFDKDPLNCFTGHRNSDTVKSVSFYGDNDEFILSGSDCGRLFFWDKISAEMVNMGAGDSGGVVNAICPHPNRAFIATAGLDSDVKIWAPSQRPKPNPLQLKNVAALNLRSIRTDAMEETLPTRQLSVIRLLRNQQFYLAPSSSEDDDDINQFISFIRTGPERPTVHPEEPPPPGEEPI